MAVKPEDITAAPEGPVKPTKTAEASDTSDGKVGELPDALLEQAPALQLLLQGSPPATFASTDAEYPELDVVAKHLKDLGKAGFGIYPTKDGSNVVLFNGLYVTPDEVKAADESGQLESIAVPYESLRNEFAGGGAEGGGGAPASGASGGMSTGVAAPGASGGQAAPSQLTTARVANLDVGAPTSGPVPGQGRILNSILKPVV